MHIDQGAVAIRFRMVLTWGNPKLRSFYWLLNRLTAAITKENDVIYVLTRIEPSYILVQRPPDHKM